MALNMRNNVPTPNPMSKNPQNIFPMLRSATTTLEETEHISHARLSYSNIGRNKFRKKIKFRKKTNVDPKVRTTPYIGDVVSVVPHHNLNPEPKTLHIIPVPLHQDHMEEIPFYKESEVRL